MNPLKADALQEAVKAARAAFRDAEEEYHKALMVAMDTGFQHSDGIHGLNIAARRSATALAKYRTAVKEWVDYFKASQGSDL